MLSAFGEINKQTVLMTATENAETDISFRISHFILQFAFTLINDHLHLINMCTWSGHLPQLEMAMKRQ